MSTTRSLVSPEISRRFNVLRTVLVLFVVGIHAEKGIIAYYSQTPDILKGYLMLFPHGLFRLSVPIFFAISGYLFYLTYTPTAPAYGRMLIKKTKSILVPYLLFNAITILLIYTFNKVPYMGDIYGLRQDGVLKMLLGAYRFPAVYPLWFLRDLYAYFILAPVFYVVSKEIPLVGLIVYWALWMFVPQAGVPVELSGMFFFYLGCLLAQTRVDLDAARRWMLPVSVAYLALLLTTAHLEFHEGMPPIYHFFYRNSMIAGTAAIWLLSGHPWFGQSALLARLSAYSFFVYLTHEPVLSYLIYVTRFVLKPTGSAQGIVYMLLLILVDTALCYGLARLLERYWPRAYAVATGAR